MYRSRVWYIANCGERKLSTTEFKFQNMNKGWLELESDPGNIRLHSIEKILTDDPTIKFQNYVNCL